MTEPEPGGTATVAPSRPLAELPPAPPKPGVPAADRRSDAPSRPTHAHLVYHHGGVLDTLQSLLYVLTLSLFVITFTLQPIRIPSSSMEPTLLVGDFLLMDKQVVAGSPHGLLPPVEIHRGDVIVFHDPVDDPTVHLVKRVVGLPGDRIHLRDGVLYRNGQAQKESYAIYRGTAADAYRDQFPDLQTMDARVNPNWWIRLRGLVHDGEVKVPPGSYFVMGDNRNDSEDSRYWGFVPRDAIVGRPLVIYFSVRQPSPEDGGAGRGDVAGTPVLVRGILSFARWDRLFHIIR